MNSIILQIAAKYVRGWLILFAIIALFRGHNNPGGGFIAGLLAALAVVYYGFAFNIRQTRENLKIAPITYIALGLIFVVVSLVPSLIAQLDLMQGVWFQIDLPVIGILKLGTPLLFDAGIFFTVIGVTILFFFSLTKVE